MAGVTPPTPEVSLSFTLKSLSHYHFTEWFKSIYTLKEHQGSHHLSVFNRQSLRSISQNKLFLDFRSMFAILSWAHKFFEESDFAKYWNGFQHFCTCPGFYVWYSGYYANGANSPSLLSLVLGIMIMRFRDREVIAVNPVLSKQKHKRHKTRIAKTQPTESHLWQIQSQNLGLLQQIFTRTNEH